MPPDPLADLNLGTGSILIPCHHEKRFVVSLSVLNPRQSAQPYFQKPYKVPLNPCAAPLSCYCIVRLEGHVVVHSKRS